MAEKIVQTAGRTQLGEFAPDFARYNDDVLFGENWNNPGYRFKNALHHYYCGPYVVGNYRFIPCISSSKCKGSWGN